MAVGLIEVFGYTTAIIAADAAAKAADVKIVALDSTKPAAGDDAEIPLVIAVKMEGSVAAVEAGVEAGMKAADGEGLGGVITHKIIANPTEDSYKMIKRCSVGRDRFIQATIKKQKEAKKA